MKKTPLISEVLNNYDKDLLDFKAGKVARVKATVQPISHTKTRLLPYRCECLELAGKVLFVYTAHIEERLFFGKTYEVNGELRYDKTYGLLIDASEVSNYQNR